MLTLKAPLEIKAKTSFIRDPESFYHRITGNYSLMETHVQEEDLLHIAATPPEIYVTEGEGISNVLQHSVRNESNYNKVQILNNVLNRIIVSADMELSYQDRVFITDALYKLGIRDDRKFMDSFYKMATETQNTNNLINLYLEQGRDIRDLVMAIETHTEKEKRAETESKEQLNINNLYNSVFNRLSTGAIYQIVSNFNRSVSYNEIDRNEYSISEQTYTAQNMLLSKMRERTGVSPDNLNLFMINENTYEGNIEEAGADITNVKNEITGAVMMDILKNIYHAGFEKFYLTKNLYYRFEDTFYKSSDQTISRLINNFGAMVTRNEVVNNLTEESNKLVNNELQLFSYSGQSVISPEEVEQIGEILQRIEENNREISQSFVQYNSSVSRFSFEELPPEKKPLDTGALTLLQIIGETADSEALQNISNSIRQTVENAGNIYEVLTEYVSNIQKDISSEQEITNSFKTDIFELLQTVEAAEKASVAADAVISIGKIIESSEAAVPVLNEYLNQISEQNIEANVSSETNIRQDTEELVQLISEAESAEPSSESIERIKEIIKGGEKLTEKERESLTLRAVEKLREKETAATLQNIENISQNELYEALGLTSIITQNIESFSQSELTQLLEAIETKQLSQQSVERIRQLISQSQTVLQTEREKLSSETPSDTEEITETTVTENYDYTKRLELFGLLEEPGESKLTIENLEYIKDIIRTTNELRNIDKKKYIERLASFQIRSVRESSVHGKAVERAKEELIRVLERSQKVRISREAREKLTESIKEFESFSEKVPAILEGPAEPETAAPVEQMGETPKTRGAQPAELVFERTVETKEGENLKQLVLNKNQLMEIINSSSLSVTRQETVAPQKFRDIIREIREEGQKQRSGYFEGNEGYQAFKAEETALAEQVTGSEEMPTTEVVKEVEKGRITDEEIKTLTENINRIDIQNEQRRRQYIEAVKTVREKKEGVPKGDAMGKTRKLAALSLESPEKLMETLSSEQIIHENREKEILTQLKDIFPEQSLEIYQMLNKYQRGGDQFTQENILRPAEVGELIYDINQAGRESEPDEGTSWKRAEIEQLEIPGVETSAKVSALQNQIPGTVRTPAETVHKYTETFDSDELNEQLQMMQRNITKNIKQDVSSEIVTESHHKNIKEVVTTDNTTEQISASQIQRMIENSVQSEMSSISDKVIRGLERKMLNEKVRRGY